MASRRTPWGEAGDRRQVVLSRRTRVKRRRGGRANHQGEEAVLSYRAIETGMRAAAAREAGGEEEHESLLMAVRFRELDHDGLHHHAAPDEEKGPFLESETDSPDEEDEETSYHFLRRDGGGGGGRHGGRQRGAQHLTGLGPTMRGGGGNIDTGFAASMPPQFLTRQWEDSIAWGDDVGDDDDDLPF